MSSTPALTVALLSDHPDCGGISCSRTRWVVKSSVAEWIPTDITWICKVYPAFSPVKHRKWWSSFPSFLRPYTAVIFSPGHDFLPILKPVQIPLIHHPSTASFGLLPSCSRLLPSCSQDPTLATSPWLSNDTAGLVSSFSRPALPDHMSFGPGLPQAHVLVCLQPWVEVSSAQGWSWAGKMMKHNEAYPPGSHVQAWETQEDWKQPAQLYKLCLTSLIGFSKETDGSVGEGRTTGIFPWLGGQDTIRVFGLVSTQKTTWMANLKCFCSVLWSSSGIQFPQGSILRPASTFYYSPWWPGGWNGVHPEQDRQCGRNSQYSAK